MWSLFSRTSSFPYEILDVVSDDKTTIWRLHKGKKRENGEEVSIFICEGESSAVLDLAKGAVKRLKMLKHPSILKFIDSMESDKSVYLVTEVVTPLLQWLSQSETQVQKSSREGLAGWGLLQITEGLNFIINGAKLVHNNINCYSIYVTQGGEWKMFGLEYATADFRHYPVKVLPHLSVYAPPESHNAANEREPTRIWSADMWGLGCLIWEVFNKKPIDKKITSEPTSQIPKSLIPTYLEIAASSPMARPDPAEVLEKLRKPGQFFHNDLIVTLRFLDEIHIKDDNEKHRFFSNLAAKLDNIPEFISKNKILPALLAAHEFSNLGSVLLTPIFKIGHILEDNDYQSQIVPCVVKMFTSTDRATRLKLLQQMETLADHLDSKTVNDQIFQPLVTGFQDTNPTIREYTVKAVLFLASKMNYNNLNVEILKHFARLQSRDDQGGIRTNTTVCLGKIASCLHPDTRQKCLVSAFTRAMRDPFPPARMAGVTALGATQQFYPLSDVASKILPALSQLTLDPEKNVRDSVFRVLKGFLGKLEKVSEDSSLREVMEKEVTTASSSASPSSWAGWAVGVASKFYKGPTQARPQPNETNKPDNSSSTSKTRQKNEDDSSFVTISGKNEAVKPAYTETKLANEESYSRTDSISKVLESVSSDDAGEGWGDDEEDWGSLEMMENPAQSSDSLDQANPGFSSASSYAWGKPSSGSDDFFSSFDKKPSTSSVSSNKPKVQSPKSTDASWNAWEENTDSKDVKDFEFDPLKDDARKLREEKKLQRQKEIEAKRAARSGPMKLGTRKGF